MKPVLIYRAGKISVTGLDAGVGFSLKRGEGFVDVGFRTEYFIARGCIDLRGREFNSDSLNQSRNF